MKIIFPKKNRPVMYEMMNNAIVEAIATYKVLYEMNLEFRNLGEVINKETNESLGYGIELNFPDWFPKPEKDIVLEFIQTFNGKVIES